MSATGGRLLAPWLVVGILILFTTKLILTEEYYDDDSYQEFSASESERRGLFPNIFNLATNSVITATATCGETHREEYCKLVEHVLLRNYVTSTPGYFPNLFFKILFSSFSDNPLIVTFAMTTTTTRDIPSSTLLMERESKRVFFWKNFLTRQILLSDGGNHLL